MRLPIVKPRRGISSNNNIIVNGNIVVNDKVQEQGKANKKKYVITKELNLVFENNSATSKTIKLFDSAENATGGDFINEYTHGQDIFNANILEPVSSSFCPVNEYLYVGCLGGGAFTRVVVLDTNDNNSVVATLLLPSTSPYCFVEYCTFDNTMWVAYKDLSSSDIRLQRINCATNSNFGANISIPFTSTPIDLKYIDFQNKMALVTSGVAQSKIELYEVSAFGTVAASVNFTKPVTNIATNDKSKEYYIIVSENNPVIKTYKRDLLETGSNLLPSIYNTITSIGYSPAHNYLYVAAKTVDSLLLIFDASTKNLLRNYNLSEGAFDSSVLNLNEDARTIQYNPQNRLIYVSSKRDILAKVITIDGFKIKSSINVKGSVSDFVFVPSKSSFYAVFPTFIDVNNNTGALSLYIAAVSNDLGATNYNSLLSQLGTEPIQVCKIDIMANSLSQLDKSLNLKVSSATGEEKSRAIYPSVYISRNQKQPKVSIPFANPLILQGKTSFESYVLLPFEVVNMTVFVCQEVSLSGALKGDWLELRGVKCGVARVQPPNPVWESIQKASNLARHDCSEICHTSEAVVLPTNPYPKWFKKPAPLPTVRTVFKSDLKVVALPAVERPLHKTQHLFLKPRITL
jgi:hypothetical protein